jgi:hypothetical protein
MLKAAIAGFLITMFGANAPSHAREACIYNLVEPEKPYLLFGHLVTPLADIIGVAECGKTLDEVKAAFAAPPLISAGADAITAGSVEYGGAPTAATPTYGCAENGSCYGDISTTTGRPKTVHVQGYHRSDGTYVRGYYRSPPRH